MIGTTLKNLLDEREIKVNEFARQIKVPAQTLYSIGEIFEIRIVTVQQANPVLFYIFKQCGIGMFADKHQINRIQRVQIIFDSIAELRTLLRRHGYCRFHQPLCEKHARPA